MHKKLLAIQSELKAPKSQRNNFGNYNYRSCEDILEAVKPLCVKHECVLTLTDDMVEIGGRVYVKATAIISSVDKPSINFQVTSYAREEEVVKGMSSSQITGAASSYARKYALNALFLIDDTKDADATNRHETSEPEKGNIESIREQIIMCDSLKAINALSEQAGKMQWSKEERTELKKKFDDKRSELK